MPRVKVSNQSAVVAPTINPTPEEPKVKKTVIKKKVVSKPVESVIVENVEVFPTEQAKQAEKPVQTPVVVETVVEQKLEESTLPTEEEKTEKKRTRRQVTKVSFYNDFEAFYKLVESELADKKSLLKQVKQLKVDSYRLLKIRNMNDDRKNKGENSNSGFMKPVLVSDDLAQFIGVDNKEPITRVLITKKICQHIKDKDLQNPADRREILPDPALKKLFSITDQDPEPLTYYGIQKRIQRHIHKIPPVVAETA